MEPQITVAVITGVVAVIGVLVTFASTRGKTHTDAKTALDQRIDARVATQLEGAWSEIDSLKTKVGDLERSDVRKMSAVGRILRAIASQWPTTHGPDLDPEDIAEIEDTIPRSWLRK